MDAALAPVDTNASAAAAPPACEDAAARAQYARAAEALEAAVERDAPAPAPPPARAIVVERVDGHDADSKLGSLYTELCRVLLARGPKGERGSWRRRKALGYAAVFLGEAIGANVPWARLGVFRAPALPPILVNFYRRRH